MYTLLKGGPAVRYSFAGRLGAMSYKEALCAVCPGVAVSVLVGGACWVLSLYNAAFDSLVAGIIAGMLLGPSVGSRPGFARGCETARRFFIPLGIASYGINLGFRLLPEVPPIAWLQILVGMIAVFVAAVWAGGRLGLRGRTSLLIGIGTAVCGASAIVVAAPAIKADKEDYSIALPAIALWGVTGCFVYPLLLEAFRFTSTAYALLAASTLHMTGVVKVAAAAGGPECLQLAMTIKLARVAMLPVIVPLLALAAAPAAAAQGRRGMGAEMKLALLALVVLGALFSYAEPFISLRDAVAPYPSLFLTIALTSIGLTSDIRAVKALLLRGAAAALAAWAACLCVFAAGYLLIGY